MCVVNHPNTHVKTYKQSGVYHTINIMDIPKYMLFNAIQQPGTGIWTLLPIIILCLFTHFTENASEFSLKTMTTQLYNFFQPRYTYTVEGRCWNAINCRYQTKRVVNIMSETYLALIRFLTLEFKGRNQLHHLYCLDVFTESVFEEHDDSVTTGLEEFTQIVPNHAVTAICVDAELDIFCNIHVEKNANNVGKDGSNDIRVYEYTIVIELYSYTASAFTIKSFVDAITSAYLETVKTSRRDKRYVYTMLSVVGNTDNDGADINKHDIIQNGIVWNEIQFNTVKTFDTVCLKNKTAVLDKIEFFLHNRSWYYAHGVPYTLGIGLHGPPGTGKTSFIKALARHTNRHIVCISMKVVTTRNQLQSVFYETRYNTQNSYIGFEDKIIVFEDIDCTGKLVMQRDDNVSADDDAGETTLENTLHKLITPKNAIQSDKALTLDDLLNMWDGIRETPGRIIVITSNFYDKLDKALIRPGRIDLEIETTTDDAMAFSQQCGSTPV